MRYAVFSDVHGNLEALTAVLDDAARQGCDEYVCLGDIVGYGPEPNECVARVRALGGRAIAGNHDAAAVGEPDLDRFSPLARAAIRWTRDVLTGETAEFLSSLSPRPETPAFLAVHGSPRDPLEEYVFGLLTALAVFAESEFTVCLVGHTHIPAVYTLGQDGRLGPERLSGGVPVRLAQGSRYIVNAGSVGQPRDGDPRAAYLLVDDLADGRAGAVMLRRVEYPVAATQAKMAERGLPETLALRLARGV